MKSVNVTLEFQRVITNLKYNQHCGSTVRRSITTNIKGRH
jgi:hypothetical protein